MNYSYDFSQYYKYRKEHPEEFSDDDYTTDDECYEMLEKYEISKYKTDHDGIITLEKEKQIKNKLKRKRSEQRLKRIKTKINFFKQRIYNEYFHQHH